MAGILDAVRLAIIIPTVNCVDYTRWMIASIKTKYPHFFILINNGSTDLTSRFFNRFILANEGVVFDWHENKGVAASWNLGIKTAINRFDCNYFFVPNNDILLHSEAVDRLIEATGPTSAVLTTGFDVCGLVNQPEDVFFMPPPGKGELSEAPEFSCFLLTKKAISKVGYFDENFYPAYFEDNDYHYRIKMAGEKALKIHDALYFHYGSRTIRDNPDVRAVSNRFYLENKAYFVRKWGGEPGREKYKYPFGFKR